MRMAMLKADSAIRRKELRARMLLQVHDELLFEAGREDAESAAAFIKRLMETTVALSPPLVADVKIGGNWDEIH